MIDLFYLIFYFINWLIYLIWFSTLLIDWFISPVFSESEYDPLSIVPDISNRVSPSTSSLSTPVVPSSATNLPGQYNFKIIVPRNTKSGLKDPHYSQKLQKLYTSRNRAVTVHVTTDTTLGTLGGPLLKISLIYTAPDYFAEPVKVCYNHSDIFHISGRQAILLNF